MNEIDCLDYLDCLDFICMGDPLCYPLCDLSYPLGSALYNNYAVCVVCGACYNDCDGFGSGCP